MQITSTFDIALPVEKSWPVLLDVPDIAPCMPGVQITEALDDGVYAYNAAVRLGPIGLNFKGRARITEADAAEHRAHVRAEGTDTKGRGRAVADVSFHLLPAPTGTHVEITTNLTLSGAVAQYARGAGMINDLANLLIGEFATNLHRKLEAEGEMGSDTKTDATGGADLLTAKRSPQTAAPIKAGSIGLKLLWRALLRAIRRI